MSQLIFTNYSCVSVAGAVSVSSVASGASVESVSSVGASVASTAGVVVSSACSSVICMFLCL